jgi:type IV pilus assembly protein PilC
MAVFSYQAKALNGSVTRGTIDAGSESEARVKIRALKLIPIQVVVGGTPGAPSAPSSFKFKARMSKVKSKDLQTFTRQLSVLVGAGVPIVPSLEALSQGFKSPSLKRALGDITQDISAGKKLGEAFGKQSQIFDRFYVNMMIAGEEGGVLELVLRRLAEYIEKAVKLNGRIKGALVYPIAVFVIAGVVVTGLLVFVIPKFAELFAGNGMELPVLTQIVMNASTFMQSYWWMIIGGVMAGVWGVKRYYLTSAGRQTIDQLLVRTPVFGDLIIKGGLAKFTRTLSTLLGAGVPIMDAMDIAAQVSGNWVLERAIMRAKEAISQGKSIATPFAQEKVFPSLVVQMMAVGEQTGSLDQMLGKIADFFEDEVDEVVGAMTALIEPLMIVFLGGIVAFLVIAMYLPIFKMAGAGGAG